MKRGAPGRDEASAQLATLRELKQQPAAYLVGWSARGLRDADVPRNKDGTYDARKLVAWLVDRESGQTDDDPLLAGGDKSEWLEKYRKEKAREAKRNNDLAEGLIYRAPIVDQSIAEIFSVFRTRAKAIEDRFGIDVGDAIRAMVAEAFGKCEKAMPPQGAKSA